MSLPLRTVFSSSVCTLPPKQMAQVMGDGKVVESSLDPLILKMRAGRREVTHTRGQGSSAALWLCDYSPAVQAPTHRLSLRLAIGFCFHSLSGEDEPNNALL